ncbi:DNA-binding response regulator [Auritidibacter sp. NML130574]|uniref:response regulator transcription factor n=1 Tax=Auritidibacter sp. NML130574 TaxID=2170745 RepID=UPI000D726A98|nr:response regulator transcription factor [Auritidibacter sp. NML130574]AXR74609.1 DNA-binding response regulator [Auritidibacter sp. NML130574]
MTHQSTPPDHEPIVYLVDDDPSVRAAVADLLASVGLRVLSFASAQQFLNHPVEDAPACLVLDVRMPGQSGMDLHRHALAEGITCPVIFITGHGDIPMAIEAMKNGAIEFLTKPFRDQDLLDAIFQGLERDRTRREAEAVTADLRARWESLTPGEQEVMKLVVQGQMNKQIATQLYLSEITVKVRRGHVMRKMEVSSLAELVRSAERLGL